MNKFIILIISALLLSSCQTVSLIDEFQEIHPQNTINWDDVFNLISHEENELEIEKGGSEYTGSPKFGELYVCKHKKEVFLVSVSKIPSGYSLYFTDTLLGKPIGQKEKKINRSMNILLTEIKDTINVQQVSPYNSGQSLRD